MNEQAIHEYIFVFKENGWWLKISSINELMNYHDKTDARWSDAFENLIHSKEFSVLNSDRTISRGNEHANTLATAIGFYGSRKRLSPITATAEMRSNIIETQINMLLKGYTIYINEKGGWHFTDEKKQKDYTEFYRKKDMIFPSFTKDQLRIKQFPMGTHWYAYLGDMQLYNKDQMKWNTYKEAYDYAQQFLNQQKE